MDQQFHCEGGPLLAFAGKQGADCGNLNTHNTKTVYFLRSPEGPCKSQTTINNVVIHAKAGTFINNHFRASVAPSNLFGGGLINPPVHLAFTKFAQLPQPPYQFQ